MATCESDGAQRSPKGETSAGRERIKRETGSAAKPRDLETLRQGDYETGSAAEPRDEEKRSAAAPQAADSVSWFDSFAPHAQLGLRPADGSLSRQSPPASAPKSPRLDSPRLAGKRPKGMRKRKVAKKPRRRSLTPEEVLAGMRPEEIEEIQALLGREQSAADFRRVDLERFNHAVLVFFQRVFAVMHLRPFQVEELTCVTHQHQLKLHPHAHAEEDVHVNLYLAGQICNGLHLRLLRVLEWVFKKCTPVWPLLVPLEA